MGVALRSMQLGLSRMVSSQLGEKMSCDDLSEALRGDDKFYVGKMDFSCNLVISDGICLTSLLVFRRRGCHATAD